MGLDFGISNTTHLNLEFMKQTKAMDSAYDLLIAVKAESTREAENVTNIEMNKTLIWARINKIKFNEQKSKVMVISRMKRKEKRKFQSI